MTDRSRLHPWWALTFTEPASIPATAIGPWQFAQLRGCLPRGLEALPRPPGFNRPLLGCLKMPVYIAVIKGAHESRLLAVIVLLLVKRSNKYQQTRIQKRRTDLFPSSRWKSVHRESPRNPTYPTRIHVYANTQESRDDGVWIC